jgi:hypothetical protein
MLVVAHKKAKTATTSPVERRSPCEPANTGTT